MSNWCKTGNGAGVTTTVNIDLIMKKMDPFGFN